MDRVSDLPHTADIGFEVEASSLDGLFELAAEGLVRALDFSSTPDSGSASERRDPERGSGRGNAEEAAAGSSERIRVSRPDLDRLLVAWLRELLHRSTRERFRPESVRVSVERASDGAASLDAEVAWRAWTEETGPGREIKGITYHGLRVAERDGVWHAEVYLDV